MPDNYIFRAEKINKKFGPTHANKDLTIALKRGEIRGLVGENGSGKSTLMSIIAGLQKKDSGDMYKENNKYDPNSPVDANKMKIGIVVQELGLVDGLSVGANVFLGRTNQFSKYGIVNLKKLYSAAKEQFHKWNLGDIPVQETVEKVSVENRKLIELARALSIDPEILILDEITAALSHDKREALFDIIDTFKKQGKAVIMISHDLEEIIERTDSITIMRDGEVIDTKESSTLTPDILKRMMVGRDVSGAYYRSDTRESFDDQVVLEVRDLSVSGEFSDVSFELHKGEILGICGLSGAGIHSLGNAIFGLKKPAKGSIYLPLQNKYIKSPLDAIRKGLAYVPKDRDKEALMVTASIEDNICLPSIKDLGGFMGFISPSKKKDLAAKAVTEYEVKTTGIKQYMNRLSGGNRQKVNLARWMSRDINIIIMDCPTRGVDVGVKAYIYDIMNKAKKDGLAIIMISDELPELIGMSDRMLIMKDGRLVKTFNRSSGLSEESIIEVMI